MHTRSLLLSITLTCGLALTACKDDEPKIAPGGTGTTPSETVPGRNAPGTPNTAGTGNGGSPGSIPPGTGTPSPPNTPTPTPDSTRPGTPTPTR